LELAKNFGRTSLEVARSCLQTSSLYATNIFDKWYILVTVSPL